MNKKENADFLFDYAMKHGITSSKALANFMGQMQVESGNFSSMNEGLHYKPERLLEVFKGRNGINTLEQAKQVTSGTQQEIANKLYGGEWGKKNLGNTEPNDGWDFRGRGYIQLTGRDNYKKYGGMIGVDLIHHPEKAAEPEISAKIAMAYWNDRIVKHGHQEDPRAATFDINAKGLGLSDRIKAAAAWEKKIHEGYANHSPLDQHSSKKSSSSLSNEQTKEVQTMLAKLGADIIADGKFGSKTEAAVKAFQKSHHLEVDGKVGSQTLAALKVASQAVQKAHQSAPSDGRALLEEKLKICTPLVKAQLFEARGLDFDSQHGLRTTLAAIELGASHGIEPIQFVGINAQTKCLCVGNKLDGVMHSASMPTSAIGAVTHETAAAALVMALQSQQQESVQQAQMTVAQVPVQGR